MDGIRTCHMLNDGDWVNGAGFASVSPITGEDWANIPEATAADVDRDRATGEPR